MRVLYTCAEGCCFEAGFVSLASTLPASMQDLRQCMLKASASLGITDGYDLKVELATLLLLFCVAFAALRL
jgi:hypothetical protein